MATVLEREPEIGPCIRVPLSALSLNGFRAWATSDELPDEVRVTYVDKGIYLDMSKETEHNALAKAGICRVLLNETEEQELGNLFLDGVLLSNEAAELSTNPDATLLTYASLEAGSVRWLEGARPHVNVEIEGTPDWILEIVSESSVFKDTKQLRAAYHRAGIPEYWLVDVRSEVIDFQILLRRKKGYVAASVKNGWQKSPVFGRAFQLVRNRTRKGYRRYILLVQAS